MKDLPKLTEWILKAFFCALTFLFFFVHWLSQPLNLFYSLYNLFFLSILHYFFFITASHQILVSLNWRTFINLSKTKNKWGWKYLIKVSCQIFFKDKQYLFLFWNPCHGRKSPIIQGLSVLLSVLSSVQNFSWKWQISFFYIWYDFRSPCGVVRDRVGLLR